MHYPGNRRTRQERRRRLGTDKFRELPRKKRNYLLNMERKFNIHALTFSLEHLYFFELAELSSWEGGTGRLKLPLAMGEALSERSMRSDDVKKKSKKGTQHYLNFNLM